MIFVVCFSYLMYFGFRVYFGNLCCVGCYLLCLVLWLFGFGGCCCLCWDWFGLVAWCIDLLVLFGLLLVVV